MVAIAFIGSVFSPYYAAARRRMGPQAAEATAHCAVNVSLYRRARRIWTMTERGAAALDRSHAHLGIGRSALHWQGDALCLRLDEWSVPWPRRVRGELRLHPDGPPRAADHALDRAGAHRWWPIAPQATVELDLQSPGLRWRGRGYLDSNRGSAPLESAFRHWHWARAHRPDGSTAVVYDAERLDGSRGALALRLAPGQPDAAFDAPPLAALPTGVWGVTQRMRSDPGQPPQHRYRYEDGPFYTRSLVQARWGREPVQAMHESLSLDRFSQRWVQALLPFRMPRRA